MKNTLTRRAGLLVSAVIILNLFGLVYGESLGRLLIPFYGYTFSMMADDFQLKSIRIEQQDVETVYRVYVASKSEYSSQRKIPLGIELSATTLTAHSLQSIIIFFVVLLVWPVSKISHKLLIVVISMPLLLILLMIDTPLVLLGSLEDLLLFQFHPELLRESKIIFWMKTMNSGGRLAMAIIIPVVVIGCVQMIAGYKISKGSRRM